MSLCQHGNKQSTCNVPCGTFRECAHPCREHESYTPPDESDGDFTYDVRRACLIETCDCGKYSDLATKEEALAYGHGFGTNMANDFIKHPEYRGANFNWHNMVDHVHNMSVLQWHLSARYGFEDEVENAANKAWLSLEPK